MLRLPPVGSALALRLPVVLVLALTLAGCGSTRFLSTWKDPSVSGAELAGKKIAAFVISPRESLRRPAENALARELDRRGADGVAGHTVLAISSADEAEAAAEILRGQGFDAVLTLQAVAQSEESSYQPGTTWFTPGYYRTWGGYWSYGWRAVYEPGYLATDTIVTVETLIYSLDSGELVWAGRSRTTNPASVEAFVAELASVLDDELVKSGLLRG